MVLEIEINGKFSSELNKNCGISKEFIFFLNLKP